MIFNTDTFNKNSDIKIRFPLQKIDEHASMVLHSIDRLSGELEEILKFEKDEKIAQEKLEGLNCTFQSRFKNLKHRIPSQALKYTERINYLLRGNTPEEHYIKKIANYPCSFNKLGDKKKNFLKKYNSFLATLKRENQDIGLLIVFHFNDLLKEMINQSSTSIPQGNAVEKTDTYNNDLETLQFKLKTTSALMRMADSLITSYRYHYNDKLVQLNQEVEDYNQFLIFTKEEEIMLIEQIAFYLEATDIVQITSEENSSVKYYKVSSDFVKVFNQMYYYSDTFPFVTKPNDWKIDNNQFPNFGGFKMNTRGIYPGAHLKGLHSQIKINQRHIDAINYLQTMKFEINKEILNYIIKNSSLCLIKYIEKSFDDDKSWESAFKKSENQEWNLLPEQEFISKGVSSKTTIEELKKWRNKYQAVISLIAQFYYTVKIATLFQNHTLFFQCFFDSRGRIYYKSFGISPQGDILSKALLDLCDPNIKPTVHPNDIQTDLNGKEFWNAIMNKFALKSQKLDVTCSGLQIIAGLCGNEKGLIDTNLIKHKGVSDCKQDLYTVILKSMDEKFPTLLEKFEQKHFNKLLIKFRNENLNRTFVKGWVMRYIYSEGNFSRATFLINECSAFKQNILIERRELYQIAIEISNLFVNSMYENYHDICNFSAQIQNLFNNNIDDQKKGPVMTILSNKNSLISKIDMSKLEAKKFGYFNPRLKRKIKMVLRLHTNVINKRKLKNSIVPNFIHHLDAEILIDVVLNCKQQNIPLATIHDCFCVFENNIELIKEFYFRAFVKIVLNRDVKITDTNYFLLMDNNLAFRNNSSTKNKMTILEEICRPWYNEQQAILSRIDKDYLEINSFILSK